MIKKFKLYILIAAVAFSATSCLDKMPDTGGCEKTARCRKILFLLTMPFRRWMM